MLEDLEGAILIKMSNHNTKKNLAWPEESVLRSLLDDESSVVRNSVLSLLVKFPDKGRSFLTKIISESDDFIAKHAKVIQQELGWTDNKEDFINFIRSRRYELETGWYLLDRTIHHNLDSTVSSLLLDELADRVRDLSTSPMDARQTCNVLNRVLFHEFGFRAAHKDFENPNNSFLHSVLERKQGLPITLSLIYILVARRVGFDLEPIGLPGRFMVGCFGQAIPFYIDVWVGGKMIDLEDMSQYIGLSIDESSGGILLPVTVSEMITRGCRNLVHHFGLKGKKEESEMFQLFVAEFERMRGIETNA